MLFSSLRKVTHIVAQLTGKTKSSFLDSLQQSLPLQSETGRRIGPEVVLHSWVACRLSTRHAYNAVYSPARYNSTAYIKLIYILILLLLLKTLKVAEFSRSQFIFFLCHSNEYLVLFLQRIFLLTKRLFKIRYSSYNASVTLVTWYRLQQRRSPSQSLIKL